MDGRLLIIQFKLNIMTQTIEEGIKYVVVDGAKMIGDVITGKATTTTPHKIVTENDVENFDSYVESLEKDELEF